MNVDLEKSYKLFIGGKWVDGTKGETFGTFCPGNGELLSTCAAAGKEDVDLAVKAAWTAFETWKDTSVAQRAGMLLKIAELVEKNAERLALVETMDNGLPIRDSRMMLPRVADIFRYFAGVVRGEDGGAVFLDKDTLSMIVREPLGVVGEITPWNMPASPVVMEDRPSPRGRGYDCNQAVVGDAPLHARTGEADIAGLTGGDL